MPSFACYTLSPTLHLPFAPEIAHARGLSDHAIIIARFTTHAPPNPDTMPIKKECFAHPRFQERLAATRRHVDLDSMPPWQRWQEHKILIRDAALHARDAILTAQKHSDFTIQGTISSTCRAIWSNNVKLANILIGRSEFAAAHIYVHGGRVIVVDATAFGTEVANLKQKFLADTSDKLEAKSNHPRTPANQQMKLRSKISAAARLSKLWLPGGKRLVIHAIRIPEADQTVSDGPGISQALADAWKPTFQKTSVESNPEFLREFRGSWNWTSAPSRQRKLSSRFFAAYQILHRGLMGFHIQHGKTQGLTASSPSTTSYASIAMGASRLHHSMTLRQSSHRKALTLPRTASCVTPSTLGRCH